MLILTCFDDAYYREPDLIIIPEGQEHEPTGKPAFVDLITGAPFNVLPGDKSGVCNQIMQSEIRKQFHACFVKFLIIF